MVTSTAEEVEKNKPKTKHIVINPIFFIGVFFEKIGCKIVSIQPLKHQATKI
jgi:hypothetical protein